MESRAGGIEKFSVEMSVLLRATDAIDPENFLRIVIPVSPTDVYESSARPASKIPVSTIAIRLGGIGIAL